MAAHEGFLREIIEHPDDDTPRLVYADWLDDHGDPERAEFIRLQIDLARQPKDDPHREARKKRERELLDVHAWEWAAGFGWPLFEEWVFRRGFIDKVQTHLQAGADHIRALLWIHPIRHLRDTSQFFDLQGLVEALPSLGGLRGLELWNLEAYDGALMRRVLTSEHLGNLRVLVLRHKNPLHADQEDLLVEAMGASARANLCCLGLGFRQGLLPKGVSEKVLRAMIASPYLKRVRKLDISGTSLTPDLLQGLLRAMPRLEHLDLRECSAPLAVWDLLLERARQAKLKSVRLREARIVETDGRERPLTRETRFRTDFKALGVRVSWTWYADPLNDGCWQGHSWDGLRKGHLLAMGPFLDARDWNGLLATYRADCVKFSGEEFAARIDALPFASFEAGLSSALRQAVDRLGSFPGARALRLNLEDRECCSFGFTADDPDQRTYPAEWLSTLSFSRIFNRSALESALEDERVPGPALVGFTEISEMDQARMDQEDYELQPLDPGALDDYLCARLLAVVGRILRLHPVPLPLLVNWRIVVFRL
jgi:uncharacterized protein (TIGR02996 family)